MTAAVETVAFARPRFALARRLLANRSFLIGAALFGFILFIAIFAGLLSPFDPLRGNFRTRMVAPSGTQSPCCFSQAWRSSIALAWYASFVEPTWQTS